MSKLRLGVNIDHVATLRNARGVSYPDPIHAAKLAQKGGADGITAHLREDRRHIRDEDIFRLKEEIPLPLNMEMAMTDEMLEIALKAMPNACCIVPEKRQELTTEGGLDVAGSVDKLKPFAAKLKKAGIRVSLFVEPNKRQLDAAKEVKADIVELHTGKYCALTAVPQERELDRIIEAARYTAKLGLECHAGHGLTYDNVKHIAAIEQMVELNIGHFLVCEALFLGIEEAVRKMRKLVDENRE